MPIFATESIMSMIIMYTVITKIVKRANFKDHVVDRVSEKAPMLKILT